MKDCSNSNENCQQRTGIIYKITNLLNGKVYVGQTIQKLNRRMNQHKHSGDDKGIDKAIQKYGWKNFKVEVIEEVPREMLNEREQFWIAHYDCMVPNGYNLTSGGNSDFTVSEETKEKLRLANEGKTLSEETKAKISASTKNPPPERRKKMSDAHKGEKNGFYGKKHTEESKAKMSASKVGTHCGEDNHFYGRKHSEESKAKMSAAQKGKVISDETRAKMSEAHKDPPPELRKKFSEINSGENNPFYGKHHTPETKAKISEAKKNISDETRAKMSEAQKGKKHTAEHKAKISASLKKYNAEKKKKAEIEISLFEDDNN